jgi:beta-N-acetylhexosaminidase
MWSRRIPKRWLLVLFLLTGITPFIHCQQAVMTEVPQDPPFLRGDLRWADSLMKTMSLEEKIGQLFTVRAYSNKGAGHVEEITRLVEKNNIGGLVFFQGGPVRQAILINYYQKKAGIPLMISQDGEWGLGMRLDSTYSFPHQMMLGAIRDDSLIYLMGKDIARQYRRIGVQVDLAPVVDVNINPNNPVINNRSFGEDPGNVAGKGWAYAHGLQDGRVLAVAKHFPGHGDTDTDSHYALPYIGHSRERLDSVELFPYRSMISKGLGGIMVAHLFVPALDTTLNRASTLSPRIVSSLLKKDMAFRGLVFTDALDMKGVGSFDEPGELEARAFLAGNDVLLLSEDVPRAIHAIRRLVKQDPDLEKDLNNRVRRILAAKSWMGLSSWQPVNIRGLRGDLCTEETDLIRHRLVQASITVLQNNDSILPLRRIDTLHIASVSIGSDMPTHFQEMLGKYTEVDAFVLPKEASEQQRMELIKKLNGYNLLIVSIHGTNDVPSRMFGITQSMALSLEQILRFPKVVVDVFGNPYCLAHLPGIHESMALVMSYEDTEISQHYSAQAILGGIPVSGRLPVTATPLYRAGTGIDLDEKIRLSFTLPEAVGLSSEKLQKVDSIALRAIDIKAMPGCVVLVAKDGAVVYHKAFGSHTYTNKTVVKPDDIYDLASVTKISATLPSLMYLYEKGKIDLSQRLGYYLPAIDTSNKGGLQLVDILTHQARLNGWIPFYQHTFELLDTSQALFSKKISDDYPFKLDNSTYLNRNYTIRKGVFSTSPSDSFPYQVANDMFMNRAYRDTIYTMIRQSPLKEKKEYRYSDLGFYYFLTVVENMTGTTLDRFVQDHYYRSLGAGTLGYRPLERFPAERIVPTENDLIFRRQLLQGYVHDPGAAMLGGVAGHAGLFSDALDLAKLMQMYLNGGTYGGIQFLQDSTLRLFSSAPFREQGNRRGIGFDKPETDPKKEGPACPLASPESFGHTGFTGTMAWVDPKYNMLYIFLSNRIHPNQYNNKLIEMNIRTVLQQAIYESLIR